MVQAKVEHAWSMYNRVLTNYWEAEDKYNESEETLATLRRAVDADVVGIHTCFPQLHCAWRLLVFW